MIQNYKNRDELWCEWGTATSAIMSYIENNEKISSTYGWRFSEGTVSKHIPGGYSVTIFNTAYDEELKEHIFLSVQADVTEADELTVHTIKRCEVDENLKKYL